jgi:hypothetical protein
VNEFVICSLYPDVCLFDVYLYRYDMIFIALLDTSKTDLPQLENLLSKSNSSTDNVVKIVYGLYLSNGFHGVIFQNFR